MKTILLALVLFAAGTLSGFYGRSGIAEDRFQQNLSALSGETLSHLDELARFTHGFSTSEIDSRWKDHVAATAVEADLIQLRESWQAWERAIIYREVEKVGWSEYRNLIIRNSALYLKSKALPGRPKVSDYAEKEGEGATTMIREAIPSELLAKETNLF